MVAGRRDAEPRASCAIPRTARVGGAALGLLCAVLVTSLGSVLVSSAATAPWTDTGQIGSCAIVGSCNGRAAVLLAGPRCRADPSLAFCGKVLLVGSSTEAPPSPQNDAHAADLFDPRDGQWTRAANTLHIRANPGAVQIDGPACTSDPTRGACGKVLVVGGNAGETPDTAELYDPARNSWTPAHPLLFFHYLWFSTVLLHGPRCGSLCGKVLVAAGGGGQGAKSEIYDPMTDTWTATGSLVTPRVEHVTTLLDGAACSTTPPAGYCGDVLVAGGFTPDRTGVTTATAELFDPAATDATTGLPGTWRPTASLAPTATSPYAPALANAAVLAGPLCGSHCGEVMIAGGVGLSATSGFAFYSAAELYDPAAGTWTATAALSSPRFDDAGVLLPSGEYLVAGGNTGLGLTATAEVYDPAAASGTWVSVGPMPRSGFNFASTLLSSGPASVCGALCGRVLVTAGGMQLAELFEGVPAVGSVAPDPVPLMGGATVISGGGLTTADQVTIDGLAIACPSTACVRDPASPDTLLDLTAPAHAAGTVTVVVHNEIGDSPLFLMRYADPVPTLTALSPSCGPTSGGTSVVITGSDFTPNSVVNFGPAPTTGAVLSSTTISVTSPPASSPGDAPIRVTTTGGPSSPLPFTYPCTATAAAPSTSQAGFPPPASQTAAQPPAYPQPLPGAQAPPASVPMAQPPPASALTAAPHGPAASSTLGGLPAAGQPAGGIAGVATDDNPDRAPAPGYAMVRHADWEISNWLAIAGSVMVAAFGLSMAAGARTTARSRRESVAHPAPAVVRSEEMTM